MSKKKTLTIIASESLKDTVKTVLNMSEEQKKKAIKFAQTYGMSAEQLRKKLKVSNG